jgi:hypothetical protein
VARQQQSLNRIDSGERDMNIIITGLTEKEIKVNNITLKDDSEKIAAVMREIGADFPDNHRMVRLGKENNNPNFHRAIKLTLANKEERDKILKKARALKDKHEPWSKIYLRRDQQPALIHEERRLRQKKKALLSDENNKDKEIKIEKGELIVDGHTVDSNVFQHF